MPDPGVGAQGPPESNHGDDRPPPRVSVIVPTYNDARLLPTAIESVLAQTFVDWELVVVDDASTDETADVVARYATDSRVRYHRQPRNGGPSAARNTGIALSRGDLLSFLDGDDYWYPRKLELQVAAFDDESVGVCGVDAFLDVRGNRTKLDRKAPPFSGDALFLELLFRNTLPGSASAVMVRRTCHEAVGPWDETLRGAEDRDLWLRLALREKFVFIPEPLVRIDRTREDRATVNWARMARNRELFLRKWESEMPDRFRHHLPRLRHYTYRSMAKSYLRIGDRRGARRYSLLAAAARRPLDRAFWEACSLFFKSFLPTRPRKNDSASRKLRSLDART